VNDLLSLSSSIPVLGLLASYSLQPSSLWPSWQSSFNGDIAKNLFLNPGSVHSFYALQPLSSVVVKYSVFYLKRVRFSYGPIHSNLQFFSYISFRPWRVFYILFNKWVRSRAGTLLQHYLGNTYNYIRHFIVFSQHLK
jgi:hypothetical protein